MGFLKFLKREKKQDIDELDLPPAPPPLEGDQTEFGTAYGFEESAELPEFPDFEEKISAPEEAKTLDLEEELPEFKFPEETSDLGKEEMPGFPPLEEEKEISQAPVMPIPTTMTEPTIKPQSLEQPVEEEPSLVPAEAFPKIERRLFTHEKRGLRERPSAKTIYVKVDRFKATLGSINMVRSDLRKSEEGLTKLENIKNAKDKSFDKARASLDDLQRKLIFIDKTLFKGD